MPPRAIYFLPFALTTAFLLLLGGSISVQITVPLPGSLSEVFPSALKRSGRKAASSNLLFRSEAGSHAEKDTVAVDRATAVSGGRRVHRYPAPPVEHGKDHQDLQTSDEAKATPGRKAHILVELTTTEAGSRQNRALPVGEGSAAQESLVPARPLCPISKTKLFLLPRTPIVSEAIGEEEELHLRTPSTVQSVSSSSNAQQAPPDAMLSAKCLNSAVQTSFIPEDCPMVPNPVHPKSFVAHWDGRAEKEVHPLDSSLGAGHARTVLASIQPLCSSGRGQSPQTIVELGAGAGALLSLLVPDNSTHFGIGTDVSLAQVEWGRKYFPHLMLEQSNGASFVREGIATCAVSTSTLMYVDADDACEHIGEALRLLAPGGVAVLWGLPRAKPKLGGWTRYSASFFVNASSGEVLPYCAHLGRLTSAVEIYEDNEPGSAFRWPYFFGVRLERNAVPLHCKYPGNSTNVRIPDREGQTDQPSDWSQKLFPLPSGES